MQKYQADEKTNMGRHRQSSRSRPAVLGSHKHNKALAHSLQPIAKHQKLNPRSLQTDTESFSAHFGGIGLGLAHIPKSSGDVATSGLVEI